MGLEADDGRPETAPPLRRGVQTADRAVVRERQAIPGDQGRVRHRAIGPAALGPGHPRQRLKALLPDHIKIQFRSEMELPPLGMSKDYITGKLKYISIEN